MRTNPVSIGLLILSLVPMMHAQSSSDWKQILAERLPAFGHRNWIVVADSAYPAQTREGIETVVAHAGQLEVLKAVLGQLSKSRHVAPQPWLDAELKYLDEKSAPGVVQYRNDLKSALSGLTPQDLPHEQIIQKLDETSRVFKVLIIKSDMTIPYTSVFLQLDCAYWTPKQEGSLRLLMKQPHP